MDQETTQSTGNVDGPPKSNSDCACARSCGEGFSKFKLSGRVSPYVVKSTMKFGRQIAGCLSFGDRPNMISERTPSLVRNFGTHQAPGRGLSELLLAYYLSAKANSPIFCRTH